MISVTVLALSSSVLVCPRSPPTWHVLEADWWLEVPGCWPDSVGPGRSYNYRISGGHQTSDIRLSRPNVQLITAAAAGDLSFYRLAQSCNQSQSSELEGEIKWFQSKLRLSEISLLYLERNIVYGNFILTFILRIFHAKNIFNRNRNISVKVNPPLLSHVSNVDLLDDVEPPRLDNFFSCSLIGFGILIFSI